MPITPTIKPGWQFILTGALFFLYAILFQVLYPIIDVPTVVLVMVPMMVSAWFFGVQGGLVAGVLGIGLNYLLLWQWYGDIPAIFFTSGLAGHFVALGTAVLIGYSRQTSRRLRYELKQRERMEKALREQESHFRTITQNMQDIVALHDPQSPYAFQYLSPSVATVLGYAPEALIGQAPQDLYHPEDQADLFSAEQRTRLQQHATITMTGRCRKANGDYIWLETRLTYVKNEQDQLILQSLSRDVTKRQEYQEKLQASEARAQRLALVARSTHNGVIITDQQGRTEWVNEGYERMLGYCLADVRGRFPGELEQAKEANKETAASIQQALQTQTGFTAELHAIHKDGHPIWVNVEAQPLLDRDGRYTGYMAVMEDITQRKQNEIELKAAKEAAETAAQLKSDFLANMSHEIRTPMNAIIGLTSLLLDSPLNHEQTDYVATLRTSGESLLTIINDILDFSKIEAGKIDIEQAPFSLRQCVEEALDLVAPKAARKHLELAYLVDAVVPDVLIGDVTRIRQILVNLLTNAVKFTDTGEVFVSVTLQERRADALAVRFAVVDSGIGIPEDRMNRLFQPFSQVDASTTRRFGGTGLGLVISRQLTQAMGGKMWLESEVGRGSTFYFTVAVSAYSNQQQFGAIQADGPLKGSHILAVDDNDINRLILKHHLQSWQVQSLVVASAADALATLQTGRRFDAAILDMQMPEMDGVMLAQAIHNQYATQLPVLVLLTSMSSHASDIPRDLFHSVLHKPLKPDQLYSELIRLLFEQKRDKKQSVDELFDETLGQRYPLRILLAEDNIVNQKVALHLLRRLGYRADLAGNGFEVLDALERQSYDLVLMDVQMPEMDGLTATAEIQTRYMPEQRPHIVALTANALKGDRERLLQAGMNDYLSKPIKVDQLIAVLRSCNPRQHDEALPPQS